MTAVIEALAWCLWAVAFLMFLPRLDRMLDLRERQLALRERLANRSPARIEH